jgi:hypothetical protein
MMHEVESWRVRLDVRMRAAEPDAGAGRLIRLSVRGPDGRLIVHARLGRYPAHPRALLTVLEGLALWRGAPLNVAISADAPVCDSLGLGAFGGEPWPTESALVRFDWRSGADRRRARVDSDLWGNHWDHLRQPFDPEQWG